MKEYNLGSISSIETMGLSDGPGIRTVIFLNGCKLRCLYCHNPETWNLKEGNITKEELINRILRYKPYYKNSGGVTFSGGEPLLQINFLCEVCEELKKYDINIALDTAGVGTGQYEKLLKYIDLVILDIKALTKEKYKVLTGYDISEFYKFLNICMKLEKKLWLRQVIIPGINDNIEYIKELAQFIKNIKGVEKIELLPYHTMGISKYKDLNISYPLENIEAMDKEKCKELEELLKKELEK